MEKIRDESDIVSVPILHKKRDIYYHCLFPFGSLKMNNRISSFLESLLTNNIEYKGERLHNSEIKLKFPEKIEFIHTKTPNMFSEIILKGLANSFNNRSRHYEVQKAFMLYDPNIIATEFPIFNKYFEGFIDIVRLGYEEKKGQQVIEIYDYKPNAKKERQKKVSSQIGLYGTLFSNIFDIPLCEIQVGYFDEKDCYILQNQCITYDYLIDFCIEKFSFLKSFAELFFTSKNKEKSIGYVKG